MLQSFEPADICLLISLTNQNQVSPFIFSGFSDCVTETDDLLATGQTQTVISAILKNVLQSTLSNVNLINFG